MNSNRWPYVFIRWLLAGLLFGLGLIALMQHLHVATNGKYPPPPVFASTATDLYVALNNPTLVFEKVIAERFQLTRDAVVAGLIGLFSVRYIGFLLSLPWRDAIPELERRVAIELTKLGVDAERVDLITLLYGIPFAEGHDPTESQIRRAKAEVGEHYEHIRNNFGRDTPALANVRFALKLAPYRGAMYALAFLVPCLLVTFAAA